MRFTGEMRLFVVFELYLFGPFCSFTMGDIGKLAHLASSQQFARSGSFRVDQYVSALFATGLTVWPCVSCCLTVRCVA